MAKFDKCVICGVKWHPSQEATHHMGKADYHRLPRHEQEWVRQEHRRTDEREHRQEDHSGHG